MAISVALLDKHSSSLHHRRVVDADVDGSRTVRGKQHFHSMGMMLIGRRQEKCNSRVKRIKFAVAQPKEWRTGGGGVNSRGRAR